MAQELLISTSKETGFDIWDFATGQHIKAISAAKCEGNAALLNDPYTLLYSDLTKPYVHTTPVPVNAAVSTTTSSSNSLPFPVSIVCSHAATGYFAGGSSTTGGCLLWDQAGNLVAQWNAHYKPISAICFTGDGIFLCTGGEDAIIHIWLV
jgi:WD40 repeat protein